METLICAGGSSLRVFEALLHLLAAGVGPDSGALRVLVIDPDQANGNAHRAALLANLYQELQLLIGGRLGTGSAGGPLKLFGTRLDLVGPSLQIWRPPGLGETLRSSLDFDELDRQQQDVARLLFTKDSLQLKLQVGFRGRPAVGAASMSMVSLAADEPPWGPLLRALSQDVAERGAARVLIVGSVFGGTGASAIHPIVRFLRDRVQADTGGLRIGVGALAPYFTFPDRELDKNGQPTARARDFPLATRSAVEYYQHLRENRDWPFDAMFWIGNSDPLDVVTAEGGATQENPSHFCEFLAAFAALDFFNGGLTDGKCYYAGPRQDAGVRNSADWPDVPRAGARIEEARAAARRLLLMGLAHDSFLSPLLAMDALDRHPHCVPWYFDLFAKRRSLRTEEDGNGLAALGKYFRSQLFRWWRDVLEGDRAQYFNKDILPAGDGQASFSGMPNIHLPNDPKKRIDVFDEFFDDLNTTAPGVRASEGLPSYVTLLANAADRYLARREGAANA